MYFDIIIIVFSFFFVVEFLSSKRITPYGFLLILCIASAIFSLIIYDNIEADDNYEYFILIFTNAYLFGLVYPFRKLKGVNAVRRISGKKFNLFLKTVNRISFVGLLLSLLYATASVLFFRTISAGVSEFKNEDIAYSYIESIFPSWLYSILGSTMPFAFLSLGLHFYFLSQNEIKKSTLSLILSLSIPLGSLIEFSRGRFVLFILLYLMLYLFLRKTFSYNVRKIIKKIFLIIFIPLIVMFMFISNDRFSGISYYGRDVNPVLFSLMDYSGQWHVNSFEVLKKYDETEIMNGSRFRYFYRRIERMFGKETTEQFDLDIEVFGYYGTRFRGVVSNLIYDLGYIGSLFFLFLFQFLVRKSKPKFNAISIYQIFLYIILSLFVVFFFQGNIVVNSMISFAILYMFLSYLFLKVKLN